METMRRRCTAWFLAAVVAGTSGAPLEFGPALRQLLRATTQMIRTSQPPTTPAGKTATTGVRA